MGCYSDLKKKLKSKSISKKKAEQLILKLQKSTMKRPEIRQSLQWTILKAIERVSNKWTNNKERLAWARILVRACAAGTVLLRDHDLEDLEKRISELEARANKRAS